MHEKIWYEGSVEQELRRIIEKLNLDRMPTYEEMNEHAPGLVNQVKAKGGNKKWAKKFGLPVAKKMCKEKQKKRMRIEDFIDESYKKRTEEAERKYAEQIKASEVTTYKLSEEELSKYKNITSKQETQLRIRVHSSLTRGNSEMRLNLEKLRKHVEEEKMTAEEIAEKYDYPIRNVKAMMGKLKPRREPFEDEDLGVKKDDKPNKQKILQLKTMEFKGEALTYRIQDNVLSLIKGNQGIRVDTEELEMIVQELKELKGVVNNG